VPYGARTARTSVRRSARSGDGWKTAAADPGMQGRSLVPLLAGEDLEGEWRDAIYYPYFEYPGWHMVRRQYAVRTDRYKLTHFYEEDGWELYDLERDPQELRSVYDHPDCADVVTRLEARLQELREAYAVPAEDPVPHRPFEAPAHLRRPGAVDATDTVAFAVEPGAGSR